MIKKGLGKVIILVNTGTPDSYEIGDVRRYLSQFLNDKNVVDLPWLLRKLLVNLIIIPFRAPKSAALYRKLWTEKGSPLKINMDNLVKKVQESVGEKFIVKGAFRYGNPSLLKTLWDLKADPPGSITLLPLYPQYASSTSGTVIELAASELKHLEKSTEIRIIDQFYSHPAYIDVMTDHLRSFNLSDYDYVLFSYHGLPLRQINRIHPRRNAAVCDCTKRMPAEGRFCYKAACYETSRILAARLRLEADKWGTSFQSRLTRNWTGPFTDEMLKKLAATGKKRVLVTAPSFVADCLETIIEINEEYRKLFLNSGGTVFTYAGCLNDNTKWAEAVLKIADQNHKY